MFKLIKIKQRDDIKIERFCELAKPLYIEYYTPLIAGVGVAELLNFLKIKIIKQEIKNNIYEYFLIEFEDRYAGILVLQAQENVLHISKIFILKRYRKKGIFKNTIEELIKMLDKKGLSELKICVAKDDRKLPVIVSKLNFKKQKQIARYFGNNIYLYEDIYTQKYKNLLIT